MLLGFGCVQMAFDPMQMHIKHLGINMFEHKGPEVGIYGLQGSMFSFDEYIDID